MPQVYARYENRAEINWTDLNCSNENKHFYNSVAWKIKLWIRNLDHDFKISLYQIVLSHWASWVSYQHMWSTPPFHLKFVVVMLQKHAVCNAPGSSDSMYEVNTSGTARSYKDFEYRPLLIMFSRTWRACSSERHVHGNIPELSFSNSFQNLLLNVGSNTRFCFSLWNSIKLSTPKIGDVMNLTNKSNNHSTSSYRKDHQILHQWYSC